MALYSICGYTVDIGVEHTGAAAKQYRCPDDTKSADITVRITDDDIKYVRRLVDDGYSDKYFSWAAACYKLGIMLPKYDGMLIHGSTVEADGHGIIFLAKSGVGKTTHTMLWKKMLGDRMRIINGDKPMVRFINGVPYAYGTPWAGKEGLHVNASVKVTDLCFIERSATNSAERITADECIGRFMDQTLHPSDPELMLKTLEMTDKLMKGCSLWRIGCNISDEAAQVAYKAIIGADAISEDSK